MDVHLGPAKQARLQEIAARVCKNAEEIVEEAVDRILDSMSALSVLWK